MRALALALLMPVAVAAQQLDDGTVDVFFQRLTRAGELEGCSLVFTALTRDYAYLRGTRVLMNGSISVRTMDGHDLYFAGKLGTRRWGDVGPAGDWEAPNHFHFTTKNGTTANKAKMAGGDTPGYKLLIARATEPEVLTLITELTDAGGFTVGFNRKAGGQDVYSPVSIDVALKKDASGSSALTRNEETLRDFAGCVSRLVDALDKRLGGK